MRVQTKKLNGQLNKFKNNKNKNKMNSTEKELHNYIVGTERMSGFDSYDSAEGDSYFDGDDMSFFDGDAMSFADGGHQQQALSDPYVVEYVNNTGLGTSVNCVLFGFNDFSGVPNFGNPTVGGGVVVTNLMVGASGSGVGYGRLFAQSNNKNFKIGKWRFQSSTSGQLQQTLQLVHVDGNGKLYSTPLNLSIMRDAYQQQSDILDVSKTLTIDGNSYLTFGLLPAATLVISMFPVAMISNKSKLNGGHGLATAVAPRLSAKNSAPVIINTMQDVKGITKI